MRNKVLTSALVVALSAPAMAKTEFDKKKAAKIAVASAVVLGSAAAAWYFLSGKSNKASETTQTSEGDELIYNIIDTEIVIDPVVARTVANKAAVNAEIKKRAASRKKAEEKKVAFKSVHAELKKASEAKAKAKVRTQKKAVHAELKKAVKAKAKAKVRTQKKAVHAELKDAVAARQIRIAKRNKAALNNEFNSRLRKAAITQHIANNHDAEFGVELADAIKARKHRIASKGPRMISIKKAILAELEEDHGVNVATLRAERDNAQKAVLSAYEQ